VGRRLGLTLPAVGSGCQGAPIYTSPLLAATPEVATRWRVKQMP
jgi:hypothetical protein